MLSISLKIRLISVVLLFTTAANYGQTDLDTKIQNNRSAAQSFMDEGKKAEAATLYNQTAYLLRNNGRSAEAAEFYQKVLALNEELGNKRGQVLTHSNLSMTYIEIEDYQNALPHLKAELKYAEESKVLENIVPILVTIATVQNELKNHNEALKYANRAAEIANEIENLSLLKSAYGITYDIHQAMKNSEEAQKYFDLYSAIDKKIKEDRMIAVEQKAAVEVNEALTQKHLTEEELDITNQQLQRTSDSLQAAELIAKQQKIELENQELQLQAHMAQLRVEKLQKRFFAIGFGVLLVFVIVLVFLLQKLRKANVKINNQRAKLEIQNRDIRASIRYAKTIQTAMLPDNDKAIAFIPNFIIYRPKDIVSGDFYWSTVVSETRMYYAIVDCTGHGVPGAFMSMIGMRMLDEIVNDLKIESPAEMLESLNTLIRSALRQEKTDNNDGMDLVICRFDKNKDGSVKVTYSGAKRPAYIIRKGQGELEILKPDRKSIGGHQPTKSYVQFNDKEFTLNKDDMLYLFSDGIIDQNNPFRKKFGSARLESILKSCCDDDIARQQALIENKLDDFMQGEKQRDDITFAGLKIS